MIEIEKSNQEANYDYRTNFPGALQQRTATFQEGWPGGDTTATTVPE
jgi:hypothetical protein